MPSNELNFDTTIPATRVGKLYNYIQIPEFNYTGIIWKGVSEIVVQFNYSLTNNFILRRYPVKPVGVNFNICIKYRVGMTVFRYKLWEELDEVMPNIPKYTGQLIKKNCVVEIWTVGGLETVSLGDVINLETSILTLPASLTDLSEVENATSALVSSLSFQTLAPSLPATGLYAQYSYGQEGIDVVTTGLDVTSMLDKSGNGRHLVATLPNRPTWTFYDGLLAPTFAATQNLALTGLNFEPKAIYLVIKQSYVAAAGVVLELNAATEFMDLRNVSTELNVYDASGSPTQLAHSIDRKLIAQRIIEPGDTESHAVTQDYFYASSAYNVVGVGYEQCGVISLGDYNLLTSESFEVFDLIIYDEFVTDAQHVQIMQYLANKNNPGGFVLANTFVDGNAWLDNN